MIHVPVWINKDENLGKEPSQRTRSFLYATLGTVVAASVKAAGVRFFENGARNVQNDDLVGRKIVALGQGPMPRNVFGQCLGPGFKTGAIENGGRSGPARPVFEPGHRIAHRRQDIPVNFGLPRLSTLVDNRQIDSRRDASDRSFLTLFFPGGF